jgi:hypothetical protein
MNLRALHKTAAPLKEISIGGKSYKIGELTKDDLNRTSEDRGRIEEVIAARGDVLKDCEAELARVSLVLLQKADPNLPAELFECMTWDDVISLRTEFLRQRDAIMEGVAKGILERPPAGNA